MNKSSPKRKKATSTASSNSEAPPNPVSEDISLQENPASVTIEVTAVEIPELTEQEISDRLYLERRVERAFFEAGKAWNSAIADYIVPRTKPLRSIAVHGLVIHEWQQPIKLLRRQLWRICQPLGNNHRWFTVSKNVNHWFTKCRNVHNWFTNIASAKAVRTSSIISE
ncbi:hypothetical protein H6G97_49740 [Nostoc flagelliforme FACHB-838]|uniref:Transposase n=1 Tax=Nostoc flagelliforme FACHB-838 TaxID=2692904 RepID=A0ABR8E5H5_9NOSO|nr:hypothetical protein [Nostoc flagelliforme FACHB-838]